MGETKDKIAKTAEKLGFTDYEFVESLQEAVSRGAELALGYSLNEGNVKIINTVKEEDKPFFTSAQWQKEAYEQIKITETEAICKKGCNRLYFYGMSPAIVLERIVLWEKDKELPESYLGPTESFFEK